MVVVGSGAGGGVVAGELADAGADVLLIESGPYKTAADFMRWEARANHELWWPPAFAEPPVAEQPPLIMFRGHCVGGTTSINTKVALRPTAQDYEKWHAAGGLLGERRRTVRRARPAGLHRARRAPPRRPRAHRLAAVREHRGARFPGARCRARAGHVVHGRELHALRFVPPGLPDERRQIDAQHLHPAGARARAARAPGRVHGRPRGDRGVRRRPTGDRGRIRRARRTPAGRRRGRRRGRGRRACDAAAADSLRRARGRRRVGERRADRSSPGLSPGAPDRRPVRRAPGRPHGLPDQLALHEVPT